MCLDPSFFNLIDDKEVEDDYITPSNSNESGVYYGGGSDVGEYIMLDDCVWNCYLTS